MSIQIESTSLYDPRGEDFSTLPESSIIYKRSIPYCERKLGMFAALSSSPTPLHILLPAERTHRRLKQLGQRIRENDEESVYELNELAAHHSRLLHARLCEVFGEDSEDTGLVHGQNGTELMAEINARVRYDGHLATYTGKVLTYSRGGKLVNKGLAGGNVRENHGVNFAANTRLFSPRQDKVDTGFVPHDFNQLLFIDSDSSEQCGNREDAYQLDAENGQGMFDQLPDDLLLAQIEETLLANDSVELATIPVIDGLGRIWPWKQIGSLIDQINIKRAENGRKPIFKLLNAVQALGRASAEDIESPLTYFDAVITVGHKGLGALPSAALLAKKTVLERLYQPGMQLPAHTEAFDSYHRVPDYCWQRNPKGLISIPEIHAFREALNVFIRRGIGSSFKDRRAYMSEWANRIRNRITSQLDPQFKILEETEGVRINPLVISFGLLDESGSFSTTKANQIKERLYNSSPSLVLSSNIGPVMRLGIPEYFYNLHSEDAQIAIVEQMADFAPQMLNRQISEI
jgi:hypothetical protein